MIKLIIVYISCFIFIGLMLNEESNKRKCINSSYKTDDYSVKNGVLYCRASDNSYQKLRKWYDFSQHLKDMHN